MWLGAFSIPIHGALCGPVVVLLRRHKLALYSVAVMVEVVALTKKKGITKRFEKKKEKKKSALNGTGCRMDRQDYLEALG